MAQILFSWGIFCIFDMDIYTAPDTRVPVPQSPEALRMANKRRFLGRVEEKAGAPARLAAFRYCLHERNKIKILLRSE